MPNFHILFPRPHHGDAGDRVHPLRLEIDGFHGEFRKMLLGTVQVGEGGVGQFVNNGNGGGCFRDGGESVGLQVVEGESG
ncbi:hypothetical protein C2S52_016120 [Perilla frutescens var. hirtella]|nr:hypothetical protein C2S52_016120 [Perilla frutescens var. hirtella]KAH6815120.1 hypothetical protein C2S51_019940 [Perilla frutescens var. frutescens]